MSTVFKNWLILARRSLFFFSLPLGWHHMNSHSKCQFIWESGYPIKAAIKRTLMKCEFRYFFLLKCFFKNIGCEWNTIAAQHQETSTLSGQTGLVYRNMKLTFSLALFRRKFLLFQSNLRSLIKEGKKLRQAFKIYSRCFHYD